MSLSDFLAVPPRIDVRTEAVRCSLRIPEVLE